MSTFNYQPPQRSTGTLSAQQAATTRSQTTSTFNENHGGEFVQNALVSQAYETLSLTRSETCRIPGYTGHMPGSADVIGQRRAAATLHTVRGEGGGGGA
jgi:hypothetical protein